MDERRAARIAQAMTEAGLAGQQEPDLLQDFASASSRPICRCRGPSIGDRYPSSGP